MEVEDGVWYKKSLQYSKVWFYAEQSYCSTFFSSCCYSTGQQQYNLSEKLQQIYLQKALVTSAWNTNIY